MVGGIHHQLARPALANTLRRSGLFLRRELFTQLGGFREMPIMEDYEFVRRPRRLGRIAIAPSSAVTSGSRWRQLGVLRTTLINRFIILAYHLGVSPARLAAWYRGAGHAMRASVPAPSSASYAAHISDTLEYPDLSKEEIFESVERFYHRYYLRPKPSLRIVKTMLEDKDVCVRRLREGYEFFKSMAQRRNDLAAARTAA
jgi:hypothetical protein